MVVMAIMVLLLILVWFNCRLVLLMFGKYVIRWDCVGVQVEFW